MNSGKNVKRFHSVLDERTMQARFKPVLPIWAPRLNVSGACVLAIRLLCLQTYMCAVVWDFVFLTWFSSDQDVFSHSDFVLWVASPVHHPPPPLHGESDICISCERPLVNTQHWRENPEGTVRSMATPISWLTAQWSHLNYRKCHAVRRLPHTNSLSSNAFILLWSQPSAASHILCTTSRRQHFNHWMNSQNLQKSHFYLWNSKNKSVQIFYKAICTFHINVIQQFTYQWFYLWFIQKFALPLFKDFQTN